MKFVHSYWRGPAEFVARDDAFHRERVNILCAAASASLIHSHGYRIELYCDRVSYESLNIIPYDDIHIIDIGVDANPMFFARCKFHALQMMKLGDVHIDNDVFIYDKNLCEKIACFNTDCIVQNIDPKSTTLNSGNMAARIYLRDIEMLYGLRAEVGSTANCGVIGIRNTSLKEMYLSQYFDILSKTKDMYPRTEIIPDLVAEQDNICRLCEKHGFSMSAIYEKPEEMYDRKAHHILYTHILGSDKYLEQHYLPLFDVVKEKDPILYDKVKDLFDA